MTDDPTKDPLAIGLGSLAMGVGCGGACMTGSQIILTLLELRFEPIGFFILTAGLITAVGLGGACGWYRSFELDNIWQRGVIAVLGAVGAVLVGFLAAVVEGFFGVIGMIVWLAASVGFGIAGSRWAVRGKGTGPT